MRSKLMDVAGWIICICIGFLRMTQLMEWTGWPKAIRIYCVTFFLQCLSTSIHRFARQNLIVTRTTDHNCIIGDCWMSFLKSILAISLFITSELSSCYVSRTNRWSNSTAHGARRCVHFTGPAMASTLHTGGFFVVDGCTFVCVLWSVCWPLYLVLHCYCNVCRHHKFVYNLHKTKVFLHATNQRTKTNAFCNCNFYAGDAVAKSIILNASPHGKLAILLMCLCVYTSACRFFWHELFDQLGQQVTNKNQI